jgi:hypothetical protein
MSNKFLSTNGADVSLTNGTASIYAASLGAAGLDPSLPVKTNSLRQLVSSRLAISDVDNLSSILNSTISSPYTGKLIVSDLETTATSSLNATLTNLASQDTALQSKTQNITATAGSTVLAGFVTTSGVLFAGSNFTALYTPATNSIGFSANNVEVLRLEQTAVTIKAPLDLDNNNITGVGDISLSGTVDGVDIAVRDALFASRTQNLTSSGTATTFGGIITTPGFLFTGSSSSSIYTPTTTSIGFAPGGVEVLRLDQVLITVQVPVDLDNNNITGVGDISLSGTVDGVDIAVRDALFALRTLNITASGTTTTFGGDIAIPDIQFTNGYLSSISTPSPTSIGFTAGGVEVLRLDQVLITVKVTVDLDNNNITGVGDISLSGTVDGVDIAARDTLFNTRTQNLTSTAGLTNITGDFKILGSTGGLTYNTTVLGLKLALFGDTYGFGVNTDAVEYITSTNTTDHQWGFGSTGSLTETMRLDSGTETLSVANLTTSGNITTGGNTTIGGNTTTKRLVSRLTVDADYFAVQQDATNALIFALYHETAGDTCEIGSAASGCNTSIYGSLTVYNNINVIGTVDGVDIATRDTLFNARTQNINASTFSGRTDIDGSLRLLGAYGGLFQNTTALGMKLAAYSNSYGIGVQSGLMEFITPWNQSGSYRWGYGLSGTLIQTMFLDSGTKTLTVDNVTTAGNLRLTGSSGGLIENTTALGMKLAIKGSTVGIGKQANMMEFIGDNDSMDYRWGYGSSGSLTETMRLTSSGKKLHLTNVEVSGSSLHNTISIFGDAGSGTRGYRQLLIGHPANFFASWRLGCQTPTPTNTDNDFYFEVSYANGSTNTAGFIQDSSNNVQMNFTGQHRCMPMFDFNSNMVGRIVETTGRYMNMIKQGEECTQRSCITVNDSIPMVKMCDTANSKRVFGIVSESEDDGDKRQTNSGSFVSLYDKVGGDKRLFINGIGEGGVWVSDTGGNLDNGDYISSAGIVSGMAGYGMKQADDFYHNYTVAKITMDCDFNPADEDVRIYDHFDAASQQIVWRFVLNADGTRKTQKKYQCVTLADGSKVAFVGCVYLCS